MGSGGYNSIILHLGTGWRWMVSFTPWPLWKTQDTCWIGYWVGTRSSQDAVKKEFSRACRESNPPSPYLVVIPTELSRLPYNPKEENLQDSWLNVKQAAVYILLYWRIVHGFLTVHFPDAIVSPASKSEPGEPGATLWPVWHRRNYQRLTLPPA
jgi:hypothetical protein